MKRFALAILLVGSFVIPACGGDDDGGITIGEACNSFAVAYCGKLDDCQATVTDCVNVFVGACCEDDNTCGEAADVTQAELDACTNAFDAQTCEAAIAGELPAECQ